MTNKTLNTGNIDQFVAYVLSEVAETAPDVVNLDHWPNAGLGYGTAIYIGKRAFHTEVWWNSVEDRLRQINPNYSLAYWWIDDGIYLIHKLADTYDDLTDDQKADFRELQARLDNRRLSMSTSFYRLTITITEITVDDDSSVIATREVENIPLADCPSYGSANSLYNDIERVTSDLLSIYGFTDYGQTVTNNNKRQLNSLQIASRGFLVAYAQEHTSSIVTNDIADSRQDTEDSTLLGYAGRWVCYGYAACRVDNSRGKHSAMLWQAKLGYRGGQQRDKDKHSSTIAGASRIAASKQG